MFALPIIERELRVQSRRPITVWLRVLVGVVGGLTGLTMLLWAEGTSLNAQAGQQLLLGLGWTGLVFGMIEGARQTADSLSEEFREGTLGLLFLTDLRGLDVVLGKLAALALGPLYALMAAFPILGLALGAGGVTPGEFWRLQLVLLDGLLLAVACGLWCSARSSGDQQALLRALALVAAFTLLPALACLVPAVRSWPSVSPGLLLTFSGESAYRSNPSRFWLSLLAVHGATWGLLVWAGAIVHGCWRGTPELPKPVHPRLLDEAGWPYRIPPSLHSARISRGHGSLLDQNPAGWLAWRRAPSRWVFWVALLVPVLSGNVNWLLHRWLGTSGRMAGVSAGVQVLTGLVPAALLSMAASRRTVDLRRSGTLEVLFCTPLSGARLALAEWDVLWCAMRWPLAAQGLLLAAPTLLLYGPRSWGTPSEAVLVMATHLLGIAKTMLIAIAAVWLGLWLGLRARTQTLAVGRTVFWVVLVPWLSMSLFALLNAWVGPAQWRSGAPPWVYYVLHVLVYGCGTVYAMALILWARRRLLTRFRRAATESL